MHEAVTVPNLMMMTLIVSEELFARDRPTTHRDTHTDAHTHTHRRTHTHTHIRVGYLP